MVNFWELKTELRNYSPIAYIDYLNRVVLSGCGKIECGKLYYFKNTSKNIFPSTMKNKYLLLRLDNVFPSSLDILDTNRGVNVTDFSSVYYFHIIGVYDNEEKLLSNSRLHGFRKNIDDNKYFSAIPLINEITHLDNYIITNSKLTMGFETSVLVNAWDDFEITHKTEIDKNFEVENSYDKHHNHL